MPRLTLLIPCPDDPGRFETTLASVLQNRPEDCEIVVAHAQPYHDPYQLGGEVCFVHVPAAHGVVPLLNAGFEASRSGVVHVLQCGWEVSEGWIESALEHFQDPQVGVVSPILVDKLQPGQILASGWELKRSGRCCFSHAGEKLESFARLRQEALGPTAVAGFYRRSLWRMLRWEHAFGDIFAPLAFALSARRLGFEVVTEADCLIQGGSQDLPRVDEAFNFQQALAVERLYWRRAGGKENWLEACRHAAWIAVETLAAVPSLRAVTGFAGRMVGMLQRGEAARYTALLAELQNRLLMPESMPNHATIPFSAQTPPLRSKSGANSQSHRRAA